MISPQPPTTVAPVSPRSRDLRHSGSLALSVAISAVLLVALYSRIDLRAVAEVLRSSNPGWVVVSVGMIVPLIVLIAIRFRMTAPMGSLDSFGEALRLTLVANALNLFLPSKLGDLVKSFFVAKRSRTTGSVAVAVIVYERLSDLFGLISFCLVGWLISGSMVTSVPSLTWLALAAVLAIIIMLISSVRAADLLIGCIKRLLPSRKLKTVRDLAEGWPSLHRALRGRRWRIALLSLFLWFLHLTQIWLFTLAISAPVPLTVCFSLTALALLIGQIPFTFGGIGARDIALVTLLSGYIGAEAAAAVAILAMSRALLPPLAALLIIRPYLSFALEEAIRWKRKL